MGNLTHYIVCIFGHEDTGFVGSKTFWRSNVNLFVKNEHRYQLRRSTYKCNRTIFRTFQFVSKPTVTACLLRCYVYGQRCVFECPAVGQNGFWTRYSRLRKHGEFNGFGPLNSVAAFHCNYVEKTTYYLRRSLGVFGHCQGADTWPQEVYQSCFLNLLCQSKIRFLFVRMCKTWIV